MVRNSLALCALLALLVPGCSFDKGIGTKDSTALGVNFALKEVEDCSNVSPEVQLENVPKDAKRVQLKFLNIELGATLFDKEFGFETTRNGLILKGDHATLPKGSVPDYQGSCAQGKPQTYSIEADVKDEQGRELGKATSTQSTGGGHSVQPVAPGPDAVPPAKSAAQ